LRSKVLDPPFWLADNYHDGEFTFDMIKNGCDLKTYQLPDLSKCEFMGYTRNNTAIAVKVSEDRIDVIDADTLTFISKIDANQAKCVIST
jgi:hypothetical protein